MTHRMITVRLDERLHRAIHDAALRHGESMNHLAIGSLLLAIERDNGVREALDRAERHCRELAAEEANKKVEACK